MSLVYSDRLAHSVEEHALCARCQFQYLAHAQIHVEDEFCPDGNGQFLPRPTRQCLICQCVLRWQETSLCEGCLRLALATQQACRVEHALGHPGAPVTPARRGKRS